MVIKYIRSKDVTLRMFNIIQVDLLAFMPCQSQSKLSCLYFFRFFFFKHIRVKSVAKEVMFVCMCVCVCDRLTVGLELGEVLQNRIMCEKYL